MYTVYMHNRERQEELSRLRAELVQLAEDLRKTLDVVLARTPLVKGNVYEITRRCGNANCRCTRGQLHHNMVLTWSEQGRRRLRSVPPVRLPELRQKSQEYARFRRARSQVLALHKKILAVVDQIQQLRCEEP